MTQAAMVASLDPRAAAALARDWTVTLARDAQLPPPGDWLVWLILAGRGFGKTRTGAEWTQEIARTSPPGTRITLAARTAADVRDTMLYGESGLMAIAPDDFRPRHVRSQRTLLWPNGVMGLTLTADEPDSFRGIQSHYAWCDELAAWRFPDAWDQLLFGLRLGQHPRVLVTTTPRPTKIIRGLVADSKGATPSVVVTRGSTYDNRANLAPSAVAELERRYKGTRLGRQELLAEILDDAPGALWKRDAIDAARWQPTQDQPDPPPYARVVVAIDPAVTSGEDSDETGIVVAALGANGEGYVLEDASGRYSPDGWARKAIRLYDDHNADRIVAEVNNGGDLVERTLRTIEERVSYKAVRASRGKAVRAEPVAALYEQGRVHHVGALPDLEDQLCSWDPSTATASPDRLDALVWAISELMVRDAAPRTFRESDYEL